jgi:hypothetical protein
MDQPIVAFLGLAGWIEKGRCDTNCTYSRSPLEEHEVKAPIKVDIRPLLEVENPVKGILERPNLDLGLPDDNVRGLFEGCKGFDGNIKGHRWEGETVKSSDSVGLNVYLKILEDLGAIICGV